MLLPWARVCTLLPGRPARPLLISVPCYLKGRISWTTLSSLQINFSPADHGFCFCEMPCIAAHSTRCGPVLVQLHNGERWPSDFSFRCTRLGLKFGILNFLFITKV
ncbi:hypothetical protein EJB05_02977, partial [Eragrostis curvula]